MLAGIYDPRWGGQAEGVVGRIRNAFGTDAEARTRFNGPLAVVSDRPAAAVRGAAGGCVLEGSIYNHRELATELGEDPHIDAETLLARAYERWEERMLPRLRGGFALVAWSKQAETILLAQDQVAVGALFVYRSGDQLTFASEVHHLLRLLPHTPGPDETALVRWIGSADLYDGLTVFAGVRRLGAGRRISISAGLSDERRYWAPTYEPPLEGSRLEVAAALKQALMSAVELRTRDVRRVGITLSGGFDSSVVAGAAASVKSNDQALYAYSTVFPDQPEMDDRDYLDLLERAMPLTNVRYQNEPGGTLEVALAYARDYKLPLSGPGWVTELPLMRRAAYDGVEVMLDGQGGDETFGLATFLIADRIRAGRLFSAVELIRHGFPGAGTGAPWRRTAGLLMHYGLRPALPYSVYSVLRGVRSRHHSPFFINDRASTLLSESGEELRWAKSTDGPLWWLSLRALLIEDREAAGLGDYTRQRSLWLGLEGRPPLFDLDLITTALRVPPHLRFDPYLDRPIGREAFAGVLPDAVRLSHRKSNLAPFYLDGLTGRDLPMIRQLLSGDRLEIGAWVRRDVVRDLLEHPPSPRAENRYEWISAIWGCVSAECWLRSLEDSSFAERILAAPLTAGLEYSEVR